ncbi:hypothetical protein B0A48_05344 [Cryoendolithus antarcticus]|uniref:DNA replication complex GINS protein PSF3 n=1 Tax=Cryoendolithus antarcticus TaxID=1507870 RepID=A0A1V8TI83_9PEZI|nr:hypothetical protein B0A48_05344 [Cryoendolithus antarcticus]
MSYYSLPQIQTDAQKVPCTTLLPLPHLGHLSGNPAQTLEKNTSLSLPLWLAEMLLIAPAPNTPAAITMDLPPPLQHRVVNALKANPVTLDLRAQAPHFYALGARMLELFEDEDLVEVLLETFRTRAVEIADRASGGVGGRAAGDEGGFLLGLEDGEKRLWEASREGSASVGKWLAGLGKG